MREQYGPSGEGRAAEIVGGEEGCGVRGVCQRHIEEDALQNDEDTNGEDADSEHAAYPVDGRIGCPTCSEDPVNDGKHVG